MPRCRSIGIRQSPPIGPPLLSFGDCGVRPDAISLLQGPLKLGHLLDQLVDLRPAFSGAFPGPVIHDNAEDRSLPESVGDISREGGYPGERTRLGPDATPNGGVKEPVAKGPIDPANCHGIHPDGTVGLTGHPRKQLDNGMWSHPVLTGKATPFLQAGGIGGGADFIEQRG